MTYNMFGGTLDLTQPTNHHCIFYTRLKIPDRLCRCHRMTYATKVDCPDIV